MKFVIAMLAIAALSACDEQYPQHRIDELEKLCEADSMQIVFQYANEGFAPRYGHLGDEHGGVVTNVWCQSKDGSWHRPKEK